MSHILTDRDHHLILCLPDATLYVMPSDVLHLIYTRGAEVPVFAVDSDGMFVKTRVTMRNSKHLIFITEGEHKHFCQYAQIRTMLATQTGRVMIQHYPSVIREMLSAPRGVRA